jgi:hypothetical protein
MIEKWRDVITKAKICQTLSQIPSPFASHHLLAVQQINFFAVRAQAKTFG